jgi:hypothetical protein
MKVKRKVLHARLLELERRVYEMETRPEPTPSTETALPASRTVRRLVDRERKTEQLNLKVSSALKERFIALATGQGMSMTDCFEWLVCQHDGQEST